ncbi:cyanate transport protein CynX [Klebsiella pneumoniae subsp. pneumoniae]|nr:cyanate transport protein CynX [Klebsiella pneumoniae subsp. pneumoniae]
MGAPCAPGSVQLAGDLSAIASRTASGQRFPRVAIIGQRRAWTLGLYFGLINAGYASLIAWLPPYYIQLGDSAQYSGSLLALLTVGQTAGALLLPALARQEDRRQLLLLALALQLIGFCGLSGCQSISLRSGPLPAAWGWAARFLCAWCWRWITPDNRRWPAGW